MKNKMKLFMSLLLAAAMLVSSVSAISAEMPESAEEIQVDETAALAEDDTATLQASTTAPASYSPTYGQLVYFNNFSGDTGFTNIADISIVDTYQNAIPSTTFDGYTVYKAGQSEMEPKTVGVEFKTNAEVWSYTDGTRMSGRATVYLEMYLDSDTVPQRHTVQYQGTTWGAYYTPWGVASGEAKPREWASIYSKTANLSTTFKRLGVLSSEWNTEYYRTLAMYVMPDNAFWLVNSDETGRTYKVIAGDTYTMPSELNGIAVDKWTNGSTTYNAGEVVAKADLAAKTFVAYTDPIGAAAPAEYNPARGQLVYFDNFSGNTGFTNLADLKRVTYTYESTSVKGGYTTLKAGQSELEPKTVGVEVTSNAADGTWKYIDGTPLSGRASMYIEKFNDPTVTTAVNRYTVGAPGTGWGGYFTTWNVSPTVDGAWSNIWSSPMDLSAYTRFGMLSDKWNNENYRVLAVYIMPDNALWLTDPDGAGRTFTMITGDNYTFPAEFAGESFEAWTDGTSLYAAGQSVAKADVAGKTFYPADAAPSTLNVASIRTTSSQGIRFAAFVDETRRNAADEYGFIIARKVALGADASKLVFDAAGTKTGTNAFGVKYTSGVSYDPNTLVDRVYDTTGDAFGTASLGEGYYFTAVLYNIAPANYKDVLVVRPYIKMGGQYIYGASAERSIYDVAVSIRDGGYTGIDDAGKAVIDGIIANAL